MRKVIIASKNPVKINAVKNGFRKIFKKENFEYSGITVSSEVSDQPMSSHETYKGAKNRVENAIKEKPDADYWIGIEGGVEKKYGNMEVFSWVYIKSKEDKIGYSKSATYLLPREIMDLILEGKELGLVCDIVFRKHNIKQNNGAVGILTKDLIDRTQYYEIPIILALIPFINKKLY